MVGPDRLLCVSGLVVAQVSRGEVKRCLLLLLFPGEVAQKEGMDRNYLLLIKRGKG